MAAQHELIYHGDACAGSHHGAGVGDETHDGGDADRPGTRQHLSDDVAIRRLVAKADQRIRDEFLSQNAYTDDAFSTPEQIAEKIGAILGFYNRAQARLKEGALLDEVLKE